MAFRSLYERKALWDQPPALSLRRQAAGLTEAGAAKIVAEVQARGGQEALERLRDAVRQVLPDQAEAAEAAKRHSKPAEAPQALPEAPAGIGTP